MVRTLVLTSEPSWQGPSLLEILKSQELQLDTVEVATSSAALLERPAISDHSYACVVSYASISGFHDVAKLGSISKLMGKAAKLVVIEPAQADKLKTDLLLGGFVDSAVTTRMDGLVQATAKTPDYETGAKAALALKRKPAAPAPAPAAPASKWVINPDDDDELIDDDELLTEEDRQQPAVNKADDCEVGAGKKACKNCTCGRADAEAQPVKLTQEMLDNPQTNCGSCGLGDAFRCAGCPYRGLPAFEPGKKIELPANFLTADA